MFHEHGFTQVPCFLQDLSCRLWRWRLPWLPCTGLLTWAEAGAVGPANLTRPAEHMGNTTCWCKQHVTCQTCQIHILTLTRMQLKNPDSPESASLLVYSDCKPRQKLFMVSLFSMAFCRDAPYPIVNSFSLSCNSLELQSSLIMFIIVRTLRQALRTASLSIQNAVFANTKDCKTQSWKPPFHFTPVQHQILENIHQALQWRWDSYTSQVIPIWRCFASAAPGLRAVALILLPNGDGAGSPQKGHSQSW